MFGIGSFEIIVILLVVLLLFGPDKLPQIAKTVGKWVNDLRGVVSDVKEGISQESEKNDDS